MLSLPAIFRVAQAFPGLRWYLWGNADRRSLVPGFLPTPPALLREGHTLWGGSPSPDVLAVLGSMRAILAFGGTRPPLWTVPHGPELLGVASFPTTGRPWVPAHQADQLDAQGIPRPRSPWLASWREEVFANHARKEVVVHPGSGDAQKNAPVDLWAAALSEVRGVIRGRQRLVVGPVELERGGWQELAAYVDQVSECRSIPELLRALKTAALFLGNDSGASHLAGAVGVPTVALFGPSDSRVWRPLGHQVRVLDAKGLGAAASSTRVTAWRGPDGWANISGREVLRQALELVPLAGQRAG